MAVRRGQNNRLSRTGVDATAHQRQLFHRAKYGEITGEQADAEAIRLGLIAYPASRDRTNIAPNSSRIGRFRWPWPGLRILTSMRCGNGQYRIDRSVSIGAGKAGAWDSTDRFTKVGTLNSATSQLWPAQP